MTVTRQPSVHPSCHSLMRYAAGDLSQGYRLLIASHLALCPHCRLELQEYEAQAGLGLESLTPEEMDANCLDNLLHKIDEYGPPACIDVTLPPPRSRASKYPEPLHAIIGAEAERISWQEIQGYGVWQSPVTTLRLFTLHRGSHYHGAPFVTQDLLLILEGDVQNHGVHYRRGDIFAPTATLEIDIREDSICLVITPQAEDRPPLLARLIGFLRGEKI